MGLFSWLKENRENREKEDSPKKVKKLPKNPELGQRYIMETSKGERMFEAKKEEGFGKYQIITMKNLKNDEKKKSKK